MSIFVNVLGQRIYATSPVDCVADKSYEFVRFKFNLSSDWDGLTVFAQFTQGDESHDRQLVDNEVCLPAEIKAGSCTLMLYGFTLNESTGDKSIIGTTNRLSFKVNPSGYVTDATTSDMSESVYQSILADIMNSTVFTDTVINTTKAKLEEFRTSGYLTNMTIGDASITGEKIANNAITGDKIANGSIARDDLSADVSVSLDLANSAIQQSDLDTAIADAMGGIKSSIDLADAAMQPSVYDPDGRAQDVFAYAETQASNVENELSVKIDTLETSLNASIDGIKQTLSESISAVSDEIVDARTVNGTTYATLGNAVRGAYSAATNYTDTALAEYESFTIEIVDELPSVGEEQTFYLIPKEVGTGYDKYWYITNTAGESVWDVFGGSSTLIVDALPEVGEPDVDYILETNSGYLYYKYIDEGWHVIAGSLAYISDALPDISEGSEFTDYYISDGAGSYSHYRFIGGGFCIVGANSYTKDEIDATVSTLVAKTEFDEAVSVRYTKSEVDALISSLESDVSANTANISSNTATVSSLSQALTSLQQEFRGLDTEGYTYYATYGTATLMTGEEAENVFTLWECKEETETIKSQFVITGGGGGTTSATNLVVERITQSPIIATPTDKVEIAISYSSTDGDGELIDGNYTWKLGTSIIMSGSLVQGTNTFDMTDYVSVGSQKLTLTVVDDGGSVSVKSWTVQVVDIRIESSFSDKITYPAGSPVSFSYTPYGAISKTVHFKLDGVELNQDDPVVTIASGISQSYVLPAQEHGAHLLECWITAMVNNMAVETEHIYKDIIWYDETSDVPVIGCVYRQDYYGEVITAQYNTTSIPYYVFDPTTSTPTVTREEDGTVVATLSMVGTSDIWAYKTDVVDKHTLTISCRGTSVTIVMDVQELGIEVTPVTGGLAFDFNPTGYSNTSANRLWTDASTGVTMTVSDNFDWQNGGYQLDEDGNQYFCVKAGTRATINYNLFERDASLYGAEFKVMFKVTNVRDIDATFLSCVADATAVGFRMDAHSAYLMTSGTGDNPLYMPYSENDIIELEYNINTLDTEATDATSLIMSYEDGVGFRPLIYDKAHRVYQYAPVPITIGSDDCDVYIYRMKAYTVALSDADILSNFIADSRDSETMLDRYYRNQIYDENNALTPESVAAACPDLKIIKIDCPYFTQDKKEMIKNTTIECIHRNGDAVLDNWKAINCYHSGQGTTSNEYGYAGRNLNIYMCFDGVYQNKNVEYDPDYITQLTLGDGTKFTDGTGKVSLTRTSVPNALFNIKVNIASSENANNALLAKRFHDYLPYTPVSKRRDPNAKTTMEFANCVVFVRENNTDLTTHREFQDNLWHFYAIGNIGDSKDTDASRAYDPDDHNEFVVEIADNTHPNSVFPTGVYDENGDMVYPIDESQWVAGNTAYDSLHNGWGDTYEFRYEHADITDEEQAANIQVWNDFYKWIITSTDEEFVEELGDWTIEAASLYMYLFTERYTMIDNRAKNTFWHYAKTYISQDEAENLGEEVASRYTIDDEAATIRNGYRFDFWDYDNDTSLGINNSGEMTMTYGKEDVDYRTDGDPNSGYIYNAAESVFFCRIRDLAYTKLQAMYLNRETANAWSSSGLITQFDTWQNMFPEELWRLDIERKYYRTYEGGTRRFLETMMNGRKKYHRRQWERDQEAYMGTKYVAASIKADQIMFRCNTPQSAVVAPNYDLRIIPYSDMYISVLYGNSSAPIQIRAKAGVEYEIKSPWDNELSEMTDTAILIYCASRIQALNDLSGSYIHDNDFSKAEKLQKLIIGNSTSGYSNEFLTNLNIGNNALLRELNVVNCPKLVGSVNLSSCGNLEIFDATGTAITGVIFAKNGKIVSAYLPGTINTLTMQNLNYLTDLQATYDSLESFAEEYSIVDEYAIVSDAADTIQTLRLLGIDWTVPDTTLLNQILKMNSSVLTGSVYISGPVRNQELLGYAEAWPDLTVTYDAANLVTQYLVTYVNADDNATVLYQTYVDRGAYPPDPYADGLIELPTLASTAQYHYYFGTSTDGIYDSGSGWDNISSPLLTNRTVVAKYTPTIRSYTVTWYSRAGLPIESVVAEYGTEVVYSGGTPTNTSEESAYVYNVFSGWDHSTGFIKEDTNVYAIWERAALPETGTDIVDMSVGEIYAVTTTGKAAEYFVLKDSVDIELGHDFEFLNVDSELLAENLYFDGSTVIDKQIKLFGENDHSFTLAIDFQFNSTSQNNTLLSCFEEDGSEGFRLRYNNGPSIQWGDQNQNVGYGTYRDIVVLRHLKGENKLHVYASNSSSSKEAFDMDIVYEEITRTASTNTESIISLGGIRFLSDGGYGDYGTGFIHWCKLWHDDLGDATARKLASWCHETIRMDYCGADIYRLADGTSKTANASFICNHLLAGRGQKINGSGTNEGGWEASYLRTFCNTRLLSALPTVWQSMIKQIKVSASAGNQSETIVLSSDYIYVPSLTEINGSTNVPYASEGTQISWYTENVYRCKFRGIVIPDDAQYFLEATDPSSVSSNNIKEGDVWRNSGNSNTAYVYVSQEYLDRNSVTPAYEATIGGGWIQASYWWLRSAQVTSSANFWYIYTTGSANSYTSSTVSCGVCPCFSI